MTEEHGSHLYIGEDNHGFSKRYATPEYIAGKVNDLVGICFNASKERGWWDVKGFYEGLAFEAYARSQVPTKLALIHSEISEALEGDRKDRMDDHLPHRKSIEVELADAVIRIADLAGALGLDLGGAIVEKLAYNAKREDHNRDHRAAAGGKAY